MASPARNHPAKNHGSVGASAITTSAGTATIEPVVITARGPSRSSTRPTTIPARAETIWLTENAAVTAVADHPRAAVIPGASTVNA